MADSYFTIEREEKYLKMLEAGDREGLRRVEFGRVIYHRRSNFLNLTRSKAAKLAGITRTQWNRYENGEVLPRPSNIPRVADALKLSASILYRAAGYEVPKEYCTFDRKRAHERLDAVMGVSSNKAEFLTHMEAAWMDEWLHEACVWVGLPDQIRLRLMAGLVAYINERLSIHDRLHLAVELVQSAPSFEVGKVMGDLGDFYAEIRARLEECRYSMFLVPVEKDFIL